MAALQLLYDPSVAKPQIQVAAAGNRLWWRNDTLHTSLLALGCAAGYFPGLGDACMQVFYS